MDYAQNKSVAEDAIKRIENAADAGVVIYRLMSHFGLVGTAFTPGDVRERVDEYIEGQGPYADYEGDIDRDVLVGEYMMYGNWDWISNRLTEVGNEMIADGVAERMRELGV